MNPILIAGTIIVNFALLFYTIFIVYERKLKKATNKVLIFISAGVTLDVTATICMIAGSTNSPFTLHGILGYSALTGMAIDAFLIWKRRLKNGVNSAFSKGLHKYSFVVYFWWLAAYITGLFIVIMK